MKFQKTVDVWTFDPIDFKALQVGQWVNSGGMIGRYLGVKPSGTVVVAWHNNAKRYANESGGYSGYIRTLRKYAKGV